MGMFKSQSRVIILLIIVASIAGGAYYYLSLSSKRIVIEGVIATCDEMTISLKSYNAENSSIIDTVSLSDKGTFRFVVDNAPEELTIYELGCGWESIPLLCRAGDRVDVGAAGSISLNYTVEGSEE